MVERRREDGRTAFVVVVILAVLALLVGGGWAVLSGVPDDGGGTTQAGDPADGAGDAGQGNEAGGDVDPAYATGGGGDSALPPPGLREGPVAAPPKNGGPWVLVSGYERTLGDVDWDLIGGVYAKMIPVLNDQANAFSRGDDFFDGDETDYFSLLFEQEELVKQRFGYERPHRTLMHPAMLANVVAATLDKRGRGLTDDQLAGLAELAETYSLLETKAEREEAGNEWYVLDVYVRVGERRRKYMYDVEALLDEKQRLLLHSEHARDRRGLDVIGAAGVWLEEPKIVMYGERIDAEEGYAGHILAGSPAEHHETILGIVSKHLKRLPPDTYERRGRIIDLMGYVKFDELMAGARMTSAILHEVEATLGADIEIPPDAVSRPLIMVPHMRD